MDVYDLILNKELGKATRPTWRKMTSIINLTYMKPDIAALDTCISTMS